MPSLTTKEKAIKLARLFSRFIHQAVDQNPAMFNRRYTRWFDYGITSWMMLCERYNRQKRCSHLKGAVGNVLLGHYQRDYNVSLHRFNTGESRIRCLYNCGFEVWNRPGWNLKWAYGMKMVERSTNRASSSEVLPKITPNKRWDEK
jgi:hypothetical protein